MVWGSRSTTTANKHEWGFLRSAPADPLHYRFAIDGKVGTPVGLTNVSQRRRSFRRLWTICTKALKTLKGFESSGRATSESLHADPASAR